MYTLQSTNDVSTQSSLPSFLSMLTHFLQPKLSVTQNRIYFQLMLTSHTSSEEEKIPYLENFLKTSGTTRTVLRYSCLKILQTSMCVDCFASCENVVPRFQTSSILLFFLHPLDWSLNPLKETLLQPVLKSFITAFTIIRGYKINQQDIRFYAWLHL